MKNSFKYLAVILAVLNLFTAERIPLDGYRLIQIIPKTFAHIQMLNNLQHIPGFDVMNGVRGLGDPVDVSLSPELFDVYSQLFTRENLPFIVVHENIQELIDQERMSMKRSGGSIVGRYARYSEIINYINTIADENSDIASTVTLGRTHENRELKALVLKTPTSQKCILIDSAIHAREWITPATTIWIIDRLVKGYRDSDPLVNELLSYYEFYILPLVNPDGYEYSHTTLRSWRKNRTPNQGSTCIGTDLNRNNGFQWLVAGASTNPCSDTYAGSKADSEIETQLVQALINSRLGEWESYVNLHTYGNIWMPIWGYTKTLSSDYADLFAVSQIAVDALKIVNGTQFTINSPANAFSPSAGGTIDWARGVAGIKWSFALELRPGIGDPDYGLTFYLPEDRAPLAGEETYVGLMAMFKAIKDFPKK